MNFEDRTIPLFDKAVINAQLAYFYGPPCRLENDCQYLTVQESVVIST